MKKGPENPKKEVKLRPPLCRPLYEEKRVEIATEIANIRIAAISSLAEGSSVNGEGERSENFSALLRTFLDHFK